MKNKAVSLRELTKLSHNSELSERYIRYICGINDDRQYRHKEIEDVAALISIMFLPEKSLSGFIYGYVVPQLNKEFDLLKITSNSCVNIELKSEDVPREKIARQLIQNRHYLRMLNKDYLYLFTFVSSTKKVWTIDNANNVIETTINHLSNVLRNIANDPAAIDLDEVYTPKNILVSPLNSPDRFLREDYLLTENQEKIKRAILEYISGKNVDRFIGLTGGPGTGKTLLIYDIARELSKSQMVLIIHSGILCEGHRILDNSLKNIKIISAKELRYREIRNVDIVIIDEAHRLYTASLDKAEKWVKKAHATCLFSFDEGQTLSTKEKWRNTSQRITNLCAENIYKLTNKIRTNKELALFITCLRDLSKCRNDYVFPNVELIYEPDKNKALEKAKKYKEKGYTYISYTPSLYNPALDYQSDTINTHNVIGQEFDGVCMLMDDNFYYTPEGKLTAKMHPNPDYLFEQLLYQGLTRVRSKIALIILSEDLLQRIITLVKNN